MLVFTPIDLPKIEPDNWVVFWKIWNSFSKPLTKVKMNHEYSTAPIGNVGLWVGLDLYKKVNYAIPWEAPFFDIQHFLPDMHDTIKSLGPNLIRARIVQSQFPVHSHSDDNIDVWNVRAFLHGKDPHKQWYFTRPNDRLGERTYIDMPTDTNWFMYNDKYCWHGTDFYPDNKKILLQLYFIGNPPDELITRSAEKYKDYTIEF